MWLSSNKQCDRCARNMQCDWAVMGVVIIEPQDYMIEQLYNINAIIEPETMWLSIDN